ncbi:MAG: transposase [Mariprofundaceae bacterium]|nr:transposase [Mariprofundaceae bacterium]
MIYVKDHKTGDMFDPFSHLGPKRLKMLTDSWPGLFRRDVLPNLPVDLLSKYYARDIGRPTKELYAMMGVMLLQQMKDLSDDEAIRQFAFNTEWHYALNITGESDAAAYICTKTLWSMRELMSRHSLEERVFVLITEHLAKVFAVDMEKQRLDSTHIFSNMKHLGRIGLFIRTIKGFLTNLKRNHKDHYTKLPTHITQRYMTKQGESGFAMVKPSESSKRLEDLATDLFALVEQFKDEHKVTAMSSYHKLVRLLKEQCIVTTDEGKGEHVEIKPCKDIASDSMQNPSDPDAGYDGHKGQGYQAQVMETYSENGDAPCLITHVAVESAHAHDAHALIPAIEATAEHGFAASEILADSLYGSDENIQDAAALGVQVISPVLGKTSEDKLGLDAFHMSADETVISCPQGKFPERITHKNEKIVAVFNIASCMSCPCKDRCPAVEGKKGFYLRYERKQVRLAVRRAFEKTNEFKEKYRWRAGEEGTNSLAKQKTGLGKLRVRGMKAVRFAITLKWLGVNILRASAYKKPNNDENGSIAMKIAWSLWSVLALMKRTGDNICHIFLFLVFCSIWTDRATQNKVMVE